MLGQQETEIEQLAHSASSSSKMEIGTEEARAQQEHSGNSNNTKMGNRKSVGAPFSDMTLEAVRQRHAEFSSERDWYV